MEGKSENKFSLVCYKEGTEWICKQQSKEETKEEREDCRILKETGIGFQGPILNVKKVCEVRNIKDFLRKW